MRSSVWLLTAQDFDASCMQIVLGSYQWPHADDKEVTKARDEGHDPDRNPQHLVSQQVLKRWYAICVGLTGPDMRCIGAVLELLKVSDRDKEQMKNKKRREKDRVRPPTAQRGDKRIKRHRVWLFRDACEECRSCVGLYEHVGQILHR